MKTITALVIPATGEEYLIELDPTDAITLDHIQEAVGGYVESAPIIDPTLTMYCNEEGKIRGLPVNERASILLGPHNPDFIVGNVVICGAPDKNGFDTTLPQALIDLVRGKENEPGS